MQQTIDINLIKESPLLFFSQLDKDAEKEFAYLLEYFVFKYDIKFDYDKKENNLSKEENGFLDFIENNKITLPENFKFNREEANAR